MNNILKITTSIFVSTSLIGCAATNGIQGKDASTGDCIAAAVAGGFFGVLVSGKKDALRGAIAGGTAAMLACLVVKSNIRQTKTAAQVEQSIRAKNKGQLPAEPSAPVYQISMKPSNRLSRDGTAQIFSTIEVADGRTNAVQKVREEVIITDPDGNQRTLDRGEFSQKTGGFEKTVEIKFNDRFLEGAYTIKTNLYINDKLVNTKNTGFELSQNSAQQIMLASN